MVFGGGGGSSAMNASSQSKQGKSNKQVSINDEQSFGGQIISINLNTNLLDNKSDDGASPGKPMSSARSST